MNAATEGLHVACLCAAWCRLCDDYRPVFEQAVATLAEAQPSLHAHWIDIEDEADLLGDLDIETFPTIVVADAAGLRFAGPLTPQPETLRRVLRAATEAAPSQVREVDPDQAAFADFAARLRRRAGGG